MDLYIASLYSNVQNPKTLASNSNFVDTEFEFKDMVYCNLVD